MYTVMWKKYKKEEYYLKAEKYYRTALASWPKLPPLLYGLFDLYQSKQDKEKMKEIGAVILNYWPDDKSIINALK